MASLLSCRVVARRALPPAPEAAPRSIELQAPLLHLPRPKRPQEATHFGHCVIAGELDGQQEGDCVRYWLLFVIAKIVLPYAALQ